MAIYFSNEAHSVKYVNNKMRTIFGEVFTINLRATKKEDKVRPDVIRRMFGMSVQYASGATQDSRNCSKKLTDYITKQNEDSNLINQAANTPEVFMNKAEFALYAKHVSTTIFGGTDDWLLSVCSYSDNEDLVDTHAYNNLLYSMMRSNADLHFMIQDFNERAIDEEMINNPEFIASVEGCSCGNIWTFRYINSDVRSAHFDATIKDYAERYNSFVISLKNCFDVIRDIAIYQSDTSKRNMSEIDELFNVHLAKSFEVFQKEMLQLNSEIEKATRLSESTLVSLVTTASLIDEMTAQNKIDSLQTRRIVNELDEFEMTKLIEENIADYRRDSSSIVGALINKYHETARIWKAQSHSVQSMITVDLKYKDKNDGQLVTIHKDMASKRVAKKVAAKRAVTNISSGFVLGLTASFVKNNFGKLKQLIIEQNKKRKA